MMLPPVSPTHALSASGPSNPDVNDVAREFETLFVSMMLKSMRQSMSQEMFAGDSSDTLGGLFDSYLGQHIAEHGGIGLAKLIQATGMSPAELSRSLQGANVTTDTGLPSARQGLSKQMEAYRNAVAVSQ